MRNLNNKGFTLIELLAVLVILMVIMGIAIPSISSSLERTKKKQDAAKIKVLLSAAELEVTDSKHQVYSNMNVHNTGACYFELGLLNVSNDNLKDSNGDLFQGIIVFEKPNKYFYKEDAVVSDGGYAYVYSDYNDNENVNINDYTQTIRSCYDGGEK